MSVLADETGRARVLLRTTDLELSGGEAAIGSTGDHVVAPPAEKLLAVRTVFVRDGAAHEHTCEMDHVWKRNCVATKEFASRALERRWCVNDNSCHEAKTRAVHAERKNRFLDENMLHSTAMCIAGISHCAGPAAEECERTVLETLDEDNMSADEINRRALELSELDCWSDADTDEE